MPVTGTVVARTNPEDRVRRVTVVSHEASRTGAPRVAVELLNALRQGGWSTTVVHRHGGPLRAELDDAADATRNEVLWRARGQLRRAGFGRTAVYLEMAAARHELKRRRPDLVWANTVVAVPYVRAACDLGIPVVWYAHEQADHVAHVLRRFGDLGTPRGALLVGCSPEAVDAFQRGMGAPDGTVELLTPPVDTEAIRYQADEARRSAPKSGEARVVAVGTGDLRKGVDIFGKAAQHSEEAGIPARWRWVGRPPAERCADVEWVGEIDDPIPEMANAAIVVVPSRAEGYPLVVMEAMAAGAAVVASDLPGIRRQVGDAGVLVPPDDVDALAEAVRELLDDPLRRKALSVAARKRSRLFDVEAFGNEVRVLSDRAIDRSVTGDQRAQCATDEPLTVVQVVWRLSPGGGVQVVLRGLIQQLDPSSVDSHVISVRPAFDRDQLEEVPARIHPVGFRRTTIGTFDRARLCLAVARTVRRIRPDLVQLHSGTAWLGIIARLQAPRTAFLLEVHDAPGSGRHGGLNDRFEGWCMRWLGMTPVCHSVQVAEALANHSRVDAKRIRRFPLGIDTDRFGPVEPQTKRAWRERHGLDPASLLVVAVGRPAPSKRFAMAIEAVAHGRSLGANLQLLIIGVGASPELRAVAEECQIDEHVALWDALYGDELAAAIAAGDVLSSTSVYEGFGLTLAEGMACGLPVVAMHVGGVGDLVAHEDTGFLVPSGDIEAHGARLALLAGDPQLADRMGSAGRERAVQMFGVAAVAEHFRELYVDLTRP